MPKKIKLSWEVCKITMNIPGEYEPALTGANGKVVKDADGDGKAHEGKKKNWFRI